MIRSNSSKLLLLISIRPRSSFLNRISTRPSCDETLGLERGNAFRFRPERSVRTVSKELFRERNGASFGRIPQLAACGFLVSMTNLTAKLLKPSTAHVE
jgi:hypothetical protein